MHNNFYPSTIEHVPTSYEDGFQLIMRSLNERTYLRLLNTVTYMR